MARREGTGRRFCHAVTVVDTGAAGVVGGGKDKRSAVFHPPTPWLGERGVCAGELFLPEVECVRSAWPLRDKAVSSGLAARTRCPPRQENTPIIWNGGADGGNDGGKKSCFGRLETISTQHFCVQVFHIDKLGLDHNAAKIYIYFATAKSCFLFFWGKRTARRNKLSQILRRRLGASPSGRFAPVHSILETPPPPSSSLAALCSQVSKRFKVNKDRR